MSMKTCLQLPGVAPSLLRARQHVVKTQFGLVIAFALSLLVPNQVLAQVKSVTAGDASIQIGGTGKNPNVAVAPNGINNDKVANDALSPAKITGTAATLGSNDFTGIQRITGDTFPGVLLAITQTGGGAGLTVSTVAGNNEALHATCTTHGLGTTDCFAVTADGTHIGVEATGVIAVRAEGSNRESNEACDACVGVQGSSVSGKGGVFRTGTGTAGIFVAGSGDILVGVNGGDINGTKKFRVDAAGNVFATAYNIGGADFAESVEPTGAKDDYHSGDVVVIDPAARRRVGFASEPYSTLVAGIYSTKPGVLATPYAMDDPRLVKEIPLAVVGICPLPGERGKWIHPGGRPPGYISHPRLRDERNGSQPHAGRGAGQSPGAPARRQRRYPGSGHLAVGEHPQEETGGSKSSSAGAPEVAGVSRSASAFPFLVLVWRADRNFHPRHPLPSIPNLILRSRDRPARKEIPPYVRPSQVSYVQRRRCWSRHHFILHSAICIRPKPGLLPAHPHDRLQR